MLNGLEMYGDGFVNLKTLRKEIREKTDVWDVYWMTHPMDLFHMMKKLPVKNIYIDTAVSREMVVKKGWRVLSESGAYDAFKEKMGTSNLRDIVDGVNNLRNRCKNGISMSRHSKDVYDCVDEMTLLCIDCVKDCYGSIAEFVDFYKQSNSIIESILISGGSGHYMEVDLDKLSFVSADLFSFHLNMFFEKENINFKKSIHSRFPKTKSQTKKVPIFHNTFDSTSKSLKNLNTMDNQTISSQDDKDSNINAINFNNNDETASNSDDEGASKTNCNDDNTTKSESDDEGASTTTSNDDNTTKSDSDDEGTSTTTSNDDNTTKSESDDEGASTTTSNDDNTTKSDSDDEGASTTTSNDDNTTKSESDDEGASTTTSNNDNTTKIDSDDDGASATNSNDDNISDSGEGQLNEHQIIISKDDQNDLNEFIDLFFEDCMDIENDKLSIDGIDRVDEIEMGYFVSLFDNIKQDLKRISMSVRKIVSENSIWGPQHINQFYKYDYVRNIFNATYFNDQSTDNVIEKYIHENEVKKSLNTIDGEHMAQVVHLVQKDFFKKLYDGQYTNQFSVDDLMEKVKTMKDVGDFFKNVIKFLLIMKLMFGSCCFFYPLFGTYSITEHDNGEEFMDRFRRVINSRSEIDDENTPIYFVTRIQKVLEFGIQRFATDQVVKKTKVIVVLSEETIDTSGEDV